MANLSKTQIDALKGVGISGCKTVEEATQKMIENLEVYQVTGVDDESFENLVMYCQAFSGSESENEPTLVDEKDAIAREVEEEDNERADEDEDEELLPPPVVKPKTAAPAKPAAKVEPKKVAPAPPAKAAPQPVAKKAAPAPKAAPKVTVNSNASIKFDGRNVEEHIEHIAWLQDFFPAEETQYDLLKQGVTLRALMANTRPTVMNFDEVRINPDGTTIGNLYLNKFKSVEELLTFLPEGFEEEYKIGMFRGETHPSIKSISQEAIINLFNSTLIVDETMKRAGKLDTKMGVNREKMVEQFKSSEQKKVAVPTATAPKKK